VFEYMAAGRAVVASRIGQLDDLIEHEVTGLVCEPGSAPDLARALNRLRIDPALCGRMGRAARDKIQGEHTWPAIVRRIFELALCEPAAPAHATGGWR
jgi:glycosyltransferase involved in cell wall biosynthesis